MTITIRLTAGYRENPLGLPGARGVMLGWSVHGEGAIDGRGGVDVEVASDEDALAAGELLWRADGVRGSVVRYGGPLPGSRRALHWRVIARDAEGAMVVSTPGVAEIGLESAEDWYAGWVSAPLVPLRRETWDPVPLLRRSFPLGRAPGRARIYVTALGTYRLWVNGTEVTAESLLRPGWTDFGIRVLHQTYDATGLLHAGENVVAVELANGWYAGWLGLQREPGFYGEHPALRLQLESEEGLLLGTDGSWRCTTGEIIASDILRGEAQDLRQAVTGWREPGFDDTGWGLVEVREEITVPITPQPHDPVAPYREFEGRLVRAHARGPAVFDFGQNMVGWTRIRTRTHPRADIIVRHGEMLSDDALVWRDNLRSAFQEDRYTTGDDGTHVLESRHTLHGFRYAEVWGLVPATPHAGLEVPDDFSITALAVGGGQRPAGAFECSDAGLTHVSRMVEWTVRDNFIEVITDCPSGTSGSAGSATPVSSPRPPPITSTSPPSSPSSSGTRPTARRRMAWSTTTPRPSCPREAVTERPAGRTAMCDSCTWRLVAMEISSPRRSISSRSSATWARSRGPTPPVSARSASARISPIG
ncbi:family 78 glycoside hydrolase catalytic domain [Microbacterium sp. NIBRBAC000506063]|nr:family 78 glycoside hydrolase catalytic domain [Microbacterium sp. NIBRBAC000506063]